VFEAKDVLARVEKMGDLFEPVQKLKQKLPQLAGLAAESEKEKEGGRGRQHRRPSPGAAARREQNADEDYKDEREVSAGRASQGIIPAREPYGASLPRYLRMGLSDMEARFLSRETCAKRFLSFLRIET